MKDDGQGEPFILNRKHTAKLCHTNDKENCAKEVKRKLDKEPTCQHNKGGKHKLDYTNGNSLANDVNNSKHDQGYTNNAHCDADNTSLINKEEEADNNKRNGGQKFI